MSTPLHIIVTCTKRKTAAVPPRLRLRSLKARSLEARAEQWIERIEETPIAKATAGEMYCGDHWMIARQLLSIASSRGFEPSLWVISTGYGLISNESEIKPYSATFSTTHDDTVCMGGSDAATTFPEWWRLLSRWGGPAKEKPRTLVELFERNRKANVLLVASEAYFSAISEDLHAAAKSLRTLEQLLVISGGTKSLSELSGSLIPLDARAQAVLGGARRTLNVRMARRILERAEGDLRAKDVRAKAQRWLAKQPDIVTIYRTRSSDDAVREFLSRELSRNPAASFTPLLSKFRSGGRACEQFRFRSLFFAAKEAGRA